jgi:hypothetical protein
LAFHQLYGFDSMVLPCLPLHAANHIAVFQETSIRRVWHNEEWWFALSDVIVVRTDSADPRQYIKKMCSRDAALDANWGTTCTPLALRAPDGKMRDTNCANTEGLFRIIQSIPSPKAEPFKRWLAQGGYQRVKEIENPEFGITSSEHSQLKELGQVKTGSNLRDHMTDLELIFTMLGEASTTEIARRSDALGFVENRTSAKQGGTIAGNARKALEAKTGKAVVIKANYLAAPSAPDLLDDAAPAQPGKPKCLSSKSPARNSKS